MPSPISAVEICNLALDAFGERGNVTSIEDPVSPTEVIMARHYDTTRKALLREEIWNFTRTEAALARTGDGGLYYRDAFATPNDCLRLLSIGFPGCGTNVGDNINVYGDNYSYEYTGDTILINPFPFNNIVFPQPTNLRIRYVKDVTDVSKFDALFIKYFYLQLAIDVSYKFSQDRLQQQELVNQLKLELPKVVSVNGQDRQPRLRRHSRWRDSRVFSDYGYSIDTSMNQLFWVNLP